MSKSWHTLWRTIKGSSDEPGKHPKLAHFFLPENKHIDDIVGIAIDGNVSGNGTLTFTWFRDLTVCAGSTTHLDDERTLYTYRLPPGKTPDDIIDMAIDGTPAEGGGMVFTWFKDGTVCAGSSSDLDRYRAPYQYRLPAGKTPDDIVGIGIDGTVPDNLGGMVFVWFRDGTVCAGSSGDLDTYRSLYPYTLPTACSPSGIIAMAIAGRGENSGDVHTWLKQDVVASGEGWHSIEAEVDKIARDAVEQHYLPGLSIAVSKHGRLVYRKSYGFANLEMNTLLRPHHRMRLGSVSKILTTLGIMKLIEDEDEIDLDTPVYGKDGILNARRYRDAIAEAACNDTIALGIAGSDDDVYAWRFDGTVSRGRTWDTDQLGAPRPFALPPDQEIGDIVDIAIAGSDDRVYTWYRDGSLSIGMSQQLDHHEYVRNAYRLPDGYRFDNGDDEHEPEEVNIVGIAIAKSDDHVYVWYDNGMVSSGTSRDFDRYRSPRPYKLPHGKKPGHIVSIDIAKNDHVYVWYVDGTVSSGTSTDLDQHRPLYDAKTHQCRSWYESIQLQHLLSHTAGFWRSGNTKAAARYFDIEEDELTYGALHLYHLHNNWLLFQPGTAAKYSNHGLGLIGHLTELISGQPYRTFIQNNFIKPLQLDIRVRPEVSLYDAYDKEDNLKPIRRYQPPINWLGVAAGGWSATPGAFVRLCVATDVDLPNNNTILSEETLRLMETPPLPTITSSRALGWVRGSKGKLSHNGRTGNAAAFAAKFPRGYISNSGVDLSHVNVTVCANVDVSTRPLRDLADQVVLLVGQADIDPDYDLF
jgi:CubicO group peptidase (beta-lactamase class C family)